MKIGVGFTCCNLCDEKIIQMVEEHQPYCKKGCHRTIHKDCSNYRDVQFRMSTGSKQRFGFCPLHAQIVKNPIFWDSIMESEKDGQMKLRGSIPDYLKDSFIAEYIGDIRTVSDYVEDLAVGAA